MKKILEFLKVDKCAHLLACMLIVYIVADADMDIWHRDMGVAIAIGALTALFVGVAKELVDFFRGGTIDLQDLKADFIGILTGAAAVLLITLCS